MSTNDPLTDSERIVLRADLDTLLDSLRRLLDDEAGLAETVDLDQSRMGRVSRIDAIQQQKMAQATLRRHQQRLERVEAAIERYDEDPEEYGPCMRCGEPIGYRRLKAFPDVVVCVGCSRA
ncbi:MAG: TraR/DksA C4-type zinc finger protein [Myxococcota bacterium]|nr:TraR/DksA C4-type zinc finger protein [Myxococcota bacterium]